MPEELETILRLVAEGTLSPEEAAPIIEVLTRAGRARSHPESHAERVARHAERAARHVERAEARAQAAVERAEAARPRARQLRIKVTERGRQVVNLRIPIGFVDAALKMVPGIGGEQAAGIRDAVRAGAIGPIVDVEEADGSGGVLISVE